MMRRILTALLALAFATTAQAQFYRPGVAPGFRPGFQFISTNAGVSVPGAVVDYDFKGNRLAGPSLNVVRAGDAYVDDSSGNWKLVPPNTLRQSDKGLLVEGAQTNSIRNNALVGAVSGQSQNTIRNNSMQGASASPSTLPTNWALSGSGANVQVIGVRSEGNLDILTVRLTGSGTANAEIVFDGANPTASSGQVWTGSAYVGLAAGSLTNLASISLRMVELGGANGNNQTNFTPGSLQRYAVTRQLTDASSTTIRVRMPFSTTGAFDFTLDVASPQLEQAPGAGPVTRTTGTAAPQQPGTLPNGTALTIPSGTTRTVYTENINGIDVLRIRVSGVTTAAGSFQFRADNGLMPATQNQLWSNSAFIQQLDLTGLQALGLPLVLEAWEYDSANAFLQTGPATTLPLAVDTSIVRRVNNRTIINAATANIGPMFRANTIASGTAINIDVRIGWSQLEQWNTAIITNGGASSPIRTTGTAATRSSDVVTATLPNALAGVGSAAVVQNETIPANFGRALQIDDGGTNNANTVASQRWNSANVAVNVRSGGAQTGNILSPRTDVARHAFAYAFANNDLALSVDGAAPAVLTTAATPASLTRLRIGSDSTGTNQSFGYIERLAVLPMRADNTTLQQLSTLSYYDSVGGFPAQGTIADYDFKGGRLYGPALTVSRASDAYMDDSAGNWTLAAANTLRRSDKGLLVEGAQTNSIRNNSMQGATLGQSQNAIANGSAQGAAVGSPGTLPSGWVSSLGGFGLTSSIVGVGADYVDIAVSGTTNANAVNILYPGPFYNQIAAAQGQIWTFSSSITLLSGSLANLSTFDLVLRENDVATTPNFVRQNAASILGAQGTPTRYVNTVTIGASTAGIATGFRMTANAGVAVNFTIRIASSQLEQAPGAGPYTRTTGTAAAFAAGTPPANWQIFSAAAGINMQVAGLGSESGIDYIDIRTTGVATSSGGARTYFETATGVAAATAQLWTESFFQKSVSGAIPTTSLVMDENASGAYVTGGSSPIAPATAAPLGSQRVSYSRTTSGGATVTSVRPYVSTALTSGTAYDFTIRIGWPQHEQWTSNTTVGGASSPIRTTGTAATRAADNITTTLPIALTSGTIASVTNQNIQTSGGQVIARISNGAGDRVDYRLQGSTAFQIAHSPNGGAQTTAGTLTGSFSPFVRNGGAAAWSNTDLAASANGSVPATGTPSAPFSAGIASMNIGSVTGAAAFFGYTERLEIFPYRAANSNLQPLSVAN